MFAVRVLVVAGALACGKALAQDAKPKTYSVNFQNASWDVVLAWYAEETGLTFVEAKDKALPKGALTLRNAVGKKFTLGETTDLLNEALIQQKWLLIRGEKSFVVVPADEKIDPALVPKVKVEDLKDRGDTELVQVVLKVPAALEDEAKELWKFLTPFGSMVRLKDTVIVTDTRKSVLRIRTILTEVEKLGQFQHLKQ